MLCWEGGTGNRSPNRRTSRRDGKRCYGVRVVRGHCHVCLRSGGGNLVVGGHCTRSGVIVSHLGGWGESNRRLDRVGIAMAVGRSGELWHFFHVVVGAMLWLPWVRRPSCMQEVKEKRRSGSGSRLLETRRITKRLGIIGKSTNEGSIEIVKAQGWRESPREGLQGKVMRGLVNLLRVKRMAGQQRMKFLVWC